jgi:putative Mn2+ efflux pump MntP
MEMTIVLVAFGLAMDSFSVSIASGLNNSKTGMLEKALTVAFFFGLFQGLMPVVGWLAGINIIDFISGFDHWIAFGLLVLIGSRMIYESIEAESRRLVNSSSIGVLLMQSVATSIDALAVGLSLAFLDTLIVEPAILIGITTFLLSFVGVYLGAKFGAFFGKRIEIVGGLILIAIGVNIVIEHLSV